LGEEIYGRERYVLVARLPRELEIQIEDTYLHLGGTTKSTLGYHITFLGPFYRECDIETLDRAVRAVTQQLMAFTVQLAGLASFRAPNSNVVFVRLENTERVLATHNALLGALESCITWTDPRMVEWMGADYHPHVTLGLGLSDHELAEFLDRSSSRQFQGAFQVSRVCMARQAPHGPWEYVAEYPLFGELPLLRPGSPPCSR